MKKALLALAALLLLAAAGAFAFRDLSRSLPATPTSAAMAGGMRFEVVTSAADQQKGLAGRSEIPDGYGMLFVFATPQKYGFWMKDMRAPIDIVWLDGAGTILLIDHSVSPSTYPETFYPPVPVKYVLETRAGYALDRGWEAGVRVPLPAPYGT